MYPTLLIGTVAIPTYPLLMLIALWAGLWLAARRADRLGLDGDHVYNAGLYGLIAGIIGARLWFVLAHWENYAENLGQALSLSRSALAVPDRTNRGANSCPYRNGGFGYRDGWIDFGPVRISCYSEGSKRAITPLGTAGCRIGMGTISERRSDEHPKIGLGLAAVRSGGRFLGLCRPVVDRHGPLARRYPRPFR